MPSSGGPTDPESGLDDHRGDRPGRGVQADVVKGDSIAEPHRDTRQAPAHDAAVGAGVVEHPSNMGVEQALKGGLMGAVAVDDRAVVVAAVVSVGVMASVVGNPGQQRALKRH